MNTQLELFGHVADGKGIIMPELDSYDKIIIAFSGGKDSTAAFLDVWDRLRRMGYTPSEIVEKIELWHHIIDGREGSKLMDWPVTESYCKAFAEAFGVPIYFSWKVGGFERELMRENAKTAPSKFEIPGGGVAQAGGMRGKQGTRRMFPQQSANLSTRWCSAYLKIDVMGIAINNQDRFLNSRTLIVTGERAEESTNRAKYDVFAPHRSDSRKGRKRKRHVDHWRNVLDWEEHSVWEIIAKHRIRVHPAYYLGFGRVSCMTCIFASANQWKTLWEMDKDKVERIVEIEKWSGKTINRHHSIPEMVAMGKAFTGGTSQDWKDALREDYGRQIIMSRWQLPKGAFGESCGPT